MYWNFPYKYWRRFTGQRLSPLRKLELVTELCEGDPELVNRVLLLLDDANASGSTSDYGRELDISDNYVLSQLLKSFRRIRLFQTRPDASVYLAEHLEHGVPVALKLSNALHDPDEARELFFKLRGLEHPSIPALYGGGELADGNRWLAREFVEGVGIIEFCQTHSVPLSERLRMFRSVCLVVAYAHHHGVIHAELKPSNILVDARKGIRVMDFGVTRHPGRRLLSPEATAYLAPEQVAAEPIGIHTDIYALGMLIFHLVVGALPPHRFRLRGDDQRTSHQWFEAREWSTASFLKDTFARATNVDRSNRFESVDSLVQCVDLCLTKMIDIEALPHHRFNWNLPEPGIWDDLDDFDSIELTTRDSPSAELCFEPNHVLELFRDGLKQQAWMLEFAVSAPFILRGGIDARDNDQLATWFSKHSELSVDVSGFVSEETQSSVSFLCLHPSGAIRSLPATVAFENARVSLLIHHTVCLLDPDSELETCPVEGLTYTLNVIAIKEVHND